MTHANRNPREAKGRQMTDNELVWMSGHEAAARIRSREVSPVELTDAELAQLEMVEPTF